MRAVCSATGPTARFLPAKPAQEGGEGQSLAVGVGARSLCFLGDFAFLAGDLSLDSEA